MRYLQRCFPILFMIAIAMVCSDAIAITDEEIFRNFQFSFLNPGARSSAMGGAFIGLADDATAAEANPAGLTILTKPEVSFEYRNTQYDAERLNAFNIVESEDIGVTIGSFNFLEEQNQPSYISVVFPAGGSTYAFSRQELSKSEGQIDEVFIVSIPDFEDFIFATTALEDRKIVNWNFSFGTKLAENFSLGATVRYSQLDWTASTDNLIENIDGDFVPLYDTRLDDDDSAFAWNAGMIYHIGSKASIGAVYKKNPKFEVEASEQGPFSLKPGTYTNSLNVPDTIGFGTAIRPSDKLTVVADVVYVEHSDLLDEIEVGHNVLTNGFDDSDITYDIDNGWDFHIGTEFVIVIGNVPIALREGYYYKTAGSLTVGSAPGVNPSALPLLDAVFSEQEDEHHFTLGNGFVFGPHFQVDWAVDLSNLSDSFILSTVVRF